MGIYPQVPKFRHDPLTGIAEMFLGDRWRVIGRMQIVFVQTTEDSGFVELHPPDLLLFASEHKDEGAEDWMKWGARVN